MLNEDRQQFQKEQDHLLKTILNLRYFQPWVDSNHDNGSLYHDSNLEIFLTAACNQKCEYCYLIKHEGLYPRDCMDHKTLLKNLRILYDWILDNEFCIPKCEFFSGEVWQTPFGLEVLELTLEYVKKGIQVGWWMSASNCSFLFDEEQTCRIQHYIDEFRRYGTSLVFSISVDGAIIEDARPMANGKMRSQEYYDRMFLFAKHNNFFFHPMVAASTVDRWIENHRWWEEHLKYWDLDINSLMMLEVRNPDWTPEAIQHYNLFNKYLIDKYIREHCEGSVERFARHLMNVRTENEDNIAINGYIPWCFPETDNFIGCTCATDLTVRIGDLALAPCHRTSYNKYLYGKFILDENDKIVDIEANNPQMACKILMSNFNLASFGCDTCTFNEYCLKGCYGAQYEEQGDPFIPAPNVCNFFKEKYGFLLWYYEKLGVIDYLYTVTQLEKEYDRVRKWLQFYETWKKREGKNYVGLSDDCSNVSK